MNQPTVIRALNGFTFTWLDSPFTVALSRIRTSIRETTGELIVTQVDDEGETCTIIHQSINLLTSKTRLAKELTVRRDAPWEEMLDHVCVLALRALRQGEPVESLEPGPEAGTICFILNPLLRERNSTILYGPGDSMKSFLALYCGMLLSSGVNGPDLRAAGRTRRVLYLDWESSAPDVRSRVKLMQTGDERLREIPDYRHCTSSLADDVVEIHRIVDGGGYDVLMIDSLALAAGGQELEKADTAMRFYAALESLDCTSLVIGHTPKPQEGMRNLTLYGSVFFRNLCRIQWECRREKQVLTLIQRKNNLGRPADPFALSMAIDETSCTWASAAVDTETS